MSKTIIGAIKVKGLPELSVFESLEQFINDLPNILHVEIEDAGLSNVIISNQQPGADDKGSLWVRRDNSGSIIGIYVYSTDKWIQILPGVNQVFILVGSNTIPPPGYKALAVGDLNLSQEQVTAIYAQLGVIANVATGEYYVYPGIFIGV